MTRRLPGKDRSREKLLQIGHAKQTCAAERRVVDGVRASECAGVGLCCLGTLLVTARLHHHHRLYPCRGAGRGHEFPGILDRLDIEENRTRCPVERKEVQQIGKIDIDAVAQRNNR